MKTFKITYNSHNNLFRGEVFTKQESAPEAMADFFDWLKEQAVWDHLWSINIQIEKVEAVTWI